MVACKTVNDYHSNQQKINRFFLDDQAAISAPQQSSWTNTRSDPIRFQPLGRAAVVHLEKENQKRQHANKKKQKSITRTKRGKRSQQEFNSRAVNFATKFKEAALTQNQRQANKLNKKKKILYSSSSEKSCSLSHARSRIKVSICLNV